MNSKGKKILIISAVVIVAIVLIYFMTGRNKPFEVTYSTAKVEYGDVSNSVTATGTVEPVTEVEVGTQVSGVVSKLYVDYNSVVKKGQVIAELDKSNLLIELSTAKANLSTSLSAFNLAKKTYLRQKSLYAKKLISANDYETAEDAYESAKNAYESAKNNLQKAKTNLGYATITSPIDGVVLSKSVEEGQTVAASFSTPTLFVIAKDLKDMQVVANVDEADIGGVKKGQRVSFQVDAYPNTTFQGTVTQVRQEATTTSNVVTYEVVISAPNPDLKLKPGLTANVTIYTAERNHVLTVPQKALRYVPTKATIGEKDTIVDCKAANKVWTRVGHRFIAHSVTVGITANPRTEILGGVTAGTIVITDAEQGEMPGKSASSSKENDNSSNSESSPFMPTPPGGRKSKK